MPAPSRLPRLPILPLLPLLPPLPRLPRHALRLSVLTSACMAALFTAAPAAGSSTTVSVNIWQGESPTGGTDTAWFNAANWLSGPLFGLPNPGMPVYFGPTQIIANGVPTDTFLLPSSEAVLGAAFTAFGLDMRAWDGISQLRLTAGGLLTTSATIGDVNSSYTPTGAIRPATLVLDGGNTAGSWSFLAHSRVVVNANYGLPGGSWSGSLGELQVNSGAAILLPSGSLTVGRVVNAGAVTVSGGNSISVSGSFQNSGSFTLGGSGSLGTAALYLTGDTTLTGGGSMVLTDANYSYIGGTGVLTVGSGNTLRGTGYVAAGIANRGTVIVEGVLTVSATGGNQFDNSGGLVQVADGSLLSVSSGSFSGGTLQGLGPGSRLGGNGNYQNLALAGQFLVTPGNPMIVAGTLTNTGVLTIGGSGSQGTAALYLLADTTLAGSGSTVLTDANYSYIGGNSVLTVADGHTLRGAGYVAASMANRGTVIAEGVLTVNASGNFDNTGGLVQVAQGGTLSLSSGVFSGGTVLGLGGGSALSGNGSFQGTALAGSLALLGATTLDGITNAGQLSVQAGASVSTRGTLANNGTLTIGGSGNQGSAALYVVADTTLAGSGTTVLTDANYSYVGGTGVLTVGSGHTLRGAGYVAATIANQGKVIADGVLTVNAGGNFDNSGGAVQVADGGTLSLSGGTFSGGTLQGLGAGSRLSGNGSFRATAMSGRLTLLGGTTLDGVSNSGLLTVDAGASASTRGTLTNNGTLTIGGSGNQGAAALYLAADTTLAGTGTTVLTDANYSYIGSQGVLTIANGHTLRGTGYVATGLTNRGTVIADGVLTVNAGGNNQFNNTGGLVQVADGGVLAVAGGSFSGGLLQGLGAGSRFGGAGTVQNLALAGQFIMTPGSSATVAGTLTSTGMLTIGGSGNQGAASLYLAADTTLAGTGTTVLTDANYSYIGGSGVLSIASGHTLRGAGYVGAGTANQGKVIADGVLTVNASGNFNNTGGLVQVADGGMLALAGGSFSGGLLQGLGAGSRFGGAGTFQNLALAGQFTMTPGSSATVAGTLTSTGVLTIGGSGNQGGASLYLAADTTLAGTGTTVLTDANYSYIGGSGVLSIASGHTLRGAGYVGASLTNQGTVQVGSGNVLTVTGSGLQNQGRLQVLAGGMLDSASVVQTAAAATTTVNGLLRTSTLTLQAGTLQGSGTVQADVLNLGGTINAGNSPGKLSIAGDLTLGDDSLLLVEVAGPARGTQFDWLAITGDVVLDGDLQLDFSGYTPQAGQQFNFLTTSTGTISGRFDHVWANGWNVSVQYDTNGLTATVSAVPEPGSWALLLLGTAALGARVRRRDRATA